MKTSQLFTLALALLAAPVQGKKAKTAAVVVPAVPQTRVLSPGEMAMAGAAATVFGVTVMHPIDTIKTLQQSSGGAGLSIVQAGSKIMKDGGIGGLYSGLGPYVTSDGCAGAFKFAT